MAMDLDANDPAVRLSWFLYTGKESTEYHSGQWFIDKHFLDKIVPSIQELAENTEKQLLPVQIILKALESNLVPNPETLVFALAVCCRQMKSAELRHVAYSALNKICVSPQHFFLFVRFAAQLNKHKELDTISQPKSGWGHGFRKAVNNWYFSKSPMELIQCVTRIKGSYGWKHKDIIKLSHPAPNNLGEEIVFKYVIHGLGEIKKTYSDYFQFAEIVKYIEKVESFKYCKDEIEAARLLKMYNLTLEHVPGHLLKSRRIWKALIPSMDLHTLLNNLLRIHNLKLLKQISLTTSKIVDQLINEENIARDKVHPALVLITLKDYEYRGKFRSRERRKFRKICDIPLPTPPKPNSHISSALYKLLNLSYIHLESTGLRYMITMRMDLKMVRRLAWRSNVTGAEAGCVIAHSLLRSEKNVTVGFFGDTKIHMWNVDRKACYDEALSSLPLIPVECLQLATPIWHAAQLNEQYDVFINIVDEISDSPSSTEEALAAYQKEHLPTAKLINWNVCTRWGKYRKRKSNKDILTINGFDARVPVVIKAFAKSLF